ncbi:hypothetical protein GCWU000341_00435 [Oribacterium sp. oral taxon 078 str. F0262]|nr:hypothetical protein GCWU000341_00435 [Oribacterium sp. oral taxon 078 str. F0262]
MARHAFGKAAWSFLPLESSPELWNKRRLRIYRGRRLFISVPEKISQKFHRK